jgi:hypothetical protein
LATVRGQSKALVVLVKANVPAALPSLFLDVSGQRHLHVGGHTDAGRAAIAMIVAKSIGAAVARTPAALASVHAVADREGVMKL